MGVRGWSIVCACISCAALAIPVLARETPVEAEDLPEQLSVRMSAGMQFDFVKKQLSPTEQQQAEAYYQLALDLVAESQSAEAEEQLRRGLGVYAGHSAARRLLAALLIKSGDFPTARSVLIEGIRLIPGDAELITLLAQVYLRIGEATQAVHTLEDYATIARGNLYFSNLLAFSYYKSGNYDKAVIIYQDLVKAQPALINAWIALGLSQESLGKFSLAMTAYRQALSSQSLVPPVRRFLDNRIEQLARVDASHEYQ